jgi:CheY-like chemotaxis protein
MPVVLIADADRHDCDLYQWFFSYHGWHVQTSGGGLECLAKLRQGAPRLLILDVQLPWGGADGLLAVMRAEPNLAHVPVVLTSTEAADESVSGLVVPPVVRALSKPFPLTTLLDFVRTQPMRADSEN